MSERLLRGLIFAFGGVVVGALLGWAQLSRWEHAHAFREMGPPPTAHDQWFYPLIGALVGAALGWVAGYWRDEISGGPS